MRRFSVLVATAVLGFFPGCNKVYWMTGTWSPPKQDQAPAAAPEPRPTATIVASGELRDALISLRRVHFAYNVARLTAGARQALDEVAAILTKHPEIQLHVDGHCDLRGSDAWNLRLGQSRADAVVGYLTSKGLSPDRLKAYSFGKGKPLASGLGIRDNAMNRRVEYRLLQGQAQIVLEQGDLVDDLGRSIASVPRALPKKLAPEPSGAKQTKK